MRFAYADTSRGQIHARIEGEGMPLVLLAWVPMSGQFYGDVQPLFAARGYRTIALDMMGFGRSTKRNGVWTIPKHAAATAEALKALDVWECVVLGGHFGASIAAELTAAGDLTVQKLIMDGGPFLTDDEMAAIFAKLGDVRRPDWEADKIAPSDLWDFGLHTLKLWSSDFQLTNENLELVYRFIEDYVATRIPDDMSGPPHDITDRLKAFDRPSLVLTAETEQLRPSYDRMLDLLPNGRGHIFPGGHPLIDPTRAQEYVDKVCGFLEEVAQ